MFSKNCDLIVRHKQLEDGQPRCIQLPIAEARLLSALVEFPTYCETPRHQGKQRMPAPSMRSSTRGGAIWVAYAECTSLMMDDLDATVA